MKKNFLILTLLTFATSLTAIAQHKWDGTIDNMFTHQKRCVALARGVEQVATEDIVNVFVNATDAQRVVNYICDAGYEATFITSEILTAHVPLGFIPTLAELEEVENIQSSQRHQKLNDTARALTGVAKVHAGRSLDTPYSGKGVVVAVIDQGFEYRHLSFLDAEGNSRVKYLWNRGSGTSTNPTTSIPVDGDHLSGGHATHVTATACGSKTGKNSYYGMAPDADIYMIPSTFDETEVLEDVSWIKKTAEANGQPWVVNMSFGGQIGPHDGSTTYCRGVSNLLGAGGIVCAAMGNEGGEAIHFGWENRKSADDRYLLVSNDVDWVYLDVWGQAADGKRHFTVTPLYYNGSTVTEMTSDQAYYCGNYLSEINVNNKKEHYRFQIRMATLRQLAGSSNAQFGIHIFCKEKGQQVHCWLNPNYGRFVGGAAGNISFKNGDDTYLVGEGASTITRAISVSSYNSGSSWTDPNTGNSYSYPSLGAAGAISSFSSSGPFLSPDGGDNTEVFKPTVCAPGAPLLSAISSYDPKFNDKDATLCDIVTVNGRKYYYAAMCGTSMATPVVSGIVALWLQANPNLTPEDIIRIIDQTAKRDSNTGGLDEDDDYNEIREEDYHSDSYGSGKIDAYEGIKMAIELRTDGIEDIHNSQAPLTIQKDGRKWQLLFNNAESYANVRVINAAGAVVKTMRISNARAGQEEILSLQGLPAGVYVVNIQTTASNQTKKVIIR